MGGCTGARSSVINGLQPTARRRRSLSPNELGWSWPILLVIPLHYSSCPLFHLSEIETIPTEPALCQGDWWIAAAAANHRCLAWTTSDQNLCTLRLDRPKVELETFTKRRLLVDRGAIPYPAGNLPTCQWYGSRVMPE